MAPKLNGVVETALYVDDLPRARAFYKDLMGLPILDGNDRFTAFDVAGQQVLLLFKRGGSVDPIESAGGTIPPHDGSGQTHVGFPITADSLGIWEEWLVRHRVTIESRVVWSRGGASLYFRDPDKNLLELLTPGVWATY